MANKKIRTRRKVKSRKLVSREKRLTVKANKKHRKTPRGLPKIFVINLRRDKEKWQKYNNDFEKGKKKLGFNYGYIVEYAFTETHSIESGFEISKKGGEIDNRNYKSHYLVLPVQVKMKSRAFGYLTYFAKTGPAIGIKLRDNVQSNSSSNNNNYGEAKDEILRELYNKAKRVIWLNPEPKMSWTVGDAEMKKYAPCCHQTEVCNSLVHLERVVSNLLRSAT